MATIFKKLTTRAMPTGATVGTRDGKQIAKWTDRKGKKRSAELTVDGKRIKTVAATWTAKYRDGEGVVREVATGCKVKQAAWSVLTELTERAELVKAKILSPEQGRIADHQSTPLTTHIEAFLEYQRQKGTHADRVTGYETRLLESAEQCRFQSLMDLSVDRLERWLVEQRKGERNMSASVYNGYRESWLAFGNWCVGKRTNRKQTHFNGEKRLITNPFAGMAKLNEEAERRRRARALTEDELRMLLEAAQARPLTHAMTVYRGKNKGELGAKVSDERKRALERVGRERALIYKCLVLTGLRANELRTLVCRDLSFGDVPFIKLQHNNEKNRRGSTLVLRSDLAADIQEWIEGRNPDDRVLNVPAGILRIMNRDLKAAGIEKKVDDCVVHVHALRHSFGTHLSMAGVAPRVAQKAMRHSNIALTMGTYTDARLLDTAEAVEALPSLPLPALQQQTVAPMVAPKPVVSSDSESIPVQSDSPQEGPSETTNPRKTLGFSRVLGMGDTGREEPPELPRFANISSNVVPGVVPSVPQLSPSNDELMAIWMRLDDQGRADLLAVARGLTKNAERKTKS